MPSSRIPQICQPQKVSRTNSFLAAGLDDCYFILRVNCKLFKYGWGVSPKTGLSHEG